MRTILEPVTAGACAPTLMICLPAAYTGPEDFLQAGFLSAVRDRELPMDLAFAPLDLQHLTDRTILRRLRHEIVLPARAQGCKSIWFCGISLGGFLALAYAEKYPDEVDGLCLLAPYLGNRIVATQIEQQGGLEGWQPGSLAPDDDERRIWRFIQNVRGSPISLHLAFGREDRFAASHRMMATALSPGQVQVTAGGHDWPVWRQLWDNFLDRRDITLGPSRTRQTLDTTATD